MKKGLKRIGKLILCVFVIGLLLPQNMQMPVDGANDKSYHPKSFWHGGWGSSVVHKGVDIFAKRGTPIHASTYGLVLASMELGKGGKCVLVLGPKWRLHYYAHLNEIKTHAFCFVTKNSVIGTVGNSGNAAKTPAHLHYSIATPIPYVWRVDDATQGWMKMFYLNPIDYLKGKPSHNGKKVAKQEPVVRKNSSVALPTVKEGDMIFQTSLSRQSGMIQRATDSPMTHCGVVVKVGKEFKVLEASNVVKLTSLASFIAKGKGHKYWIKNSKLASGDKIDYKPYLGKRYDLAFQFENDSYYCSELIYVIYKDQFGISLCEPKRVSEYKISGLEDVMRKRGIASDQQVVAPVDLFMN